MTLQPGVYDVSPTETPRGLLKRLADGDVAKVKVTFPEGFTIEKIASRLKDRGVIASEEDILTLVAQNGNTLKASVCAAAQFRGVSVPGHVLVSGRRDGKRGRPADAVALRPSGGSGAKPPTSSGAKNLSRRS
jgi:hypothetical protein